MAAIQVLVSGGFGSDPKVGPQAVKGNIWEK